MKKRLLSSLSSLLILFSLVAPGVVLAATSSTGGTTYTILLDAPDVDYDDNDNDYTVDISGTISATTTSGNGDVGDENCFFVVATWGDGSSEIIELTGPEVFDPNTSGGDFGPISYSDSHTYTSDNGPYTITTTLRRVVDGGGSCPSVTTSSGDSRVSESSSPIIVPSFSIAGTPAINGLTVTLDGVSGETASGVNYCDDDEDGFDVEVLWGDGQSRFGSNENDDSFNDPNGSPKAFTGTWNAGSHTYAAAGTYTITMNLYEAEGCPSNPPALVATATTQVTVSAPAPATGNLTVTKVVVNDNGGTKTAQQFPLFVTPNGGSTIGVTSGATNAYAPVTYTVTETGDANYTATFSGDCNSSGVVTVVAGQNKTCTITNNDKPALLTIKKIVNNTHGGIAVSGQFTMFVTGTDVSNSSFPGLTTGTTVTLDAGAYNVTESSLVGYTQQSAVGCSGSLTIGQTQECVITNVDMDPTLTVTKVVVGGPQDINTGAWTTSDPALFELYVDATQVTSGAANSFPVGTYTVSEIIPDIDPLVDPEYIGVFSGACNPATGVVQLDFADNDQCTLTNYYVPMCQADPSLCPQLYSVASTLTVKKNVTNDNGGNKASADFALQLQGSNNTLQQFAGDVLGKIFWLLPGTYNVTETPVSGYVGDFTACGNAGTVTLGTQETIECSVVNDDQAGELTVTKVIDASLPNAVVTDFVLSIQRVEDLNGGAVADAPVSVTSGVAATGLPAGLYQVTEVPGAGYVSKFTGKQNCDADGFVTVGNGESRTCEITNYATPTITVTKIVLNDNKGTATVTDFPLIVCEAASFGSTQQVCTTVVSGTTNVFAPGDYFIDEIYDDNNGVNGVGYTAIYSGDCDGVNPITLNPGDAKTCTITNSDFGDTDDAAGGGTAGGGGGGGGSVLGESVTQETTDGDGGGEEGGNDDGGTDDGGEDDGGEDEPSEDTPAEEDEGEVLDETSCTPFLNSYIHILKKNNADDVSRLQTFLNSHLGLSLGLTGNYDQNTFNAVKKLQVMHADEILKPWGLTAPTGYVYITTRRFINMEHCKGMQFDPGALPPLVRDNNIND